jgi:hypothetical protein
MYRLFASFGNLISLLFSVLSCFAQTVIRDRTVTEPHPSRPAHAAVKRSESSHSSSEQPLAEDNNPALQYDGVFTLVPRVIASASFSSFLLFQRDISLCNIRTESSFEQGVLIERRKE